MNELIWQRKPISICLTSNHIETTTNQNIYQITPSENNNIEEDVQILKAYYVLHQLLVDALNKPVLLLPSHFISVTQIKLFAPYHFDHTTFPDWLKQPGKPTLRISNGGVKDNYANNYIAFNNWKYIKLLQRKTSYKNRKLEIEDLPQPVPTTTDTCEVAEPVQIKIET